MTSEVNRVIEMDVTYLIHQTVTYHVYLHEGGDSIARIEEVISKGEADAHPQIEAVRAVFSPGSTKRGLVRRRVSMTPEEYESRFGF